MEKSRAKRGECIVKCKNNLIKQARKFTELADKATHGPWRWIDGGSLGLYDVYEEEDVLYPRNTMYPDFPLSPEVTEEWWSSVLGACGLRAEKQAPFNAALLAAAPEMARLISKLVEELENPGSWQGEEYEAWANDEVKEEGDND